MPDAARAAFVGSMTLLFYTCGNGKYEDFAPLFIASTLWSTPGAIAEVGLVSAADYAQRNAELMGALQEHFGSRALLRDAPWERNGRRLLPHLVRFVTPPHSRADYIYISDIDIIFLDSEFPAKHLEFMSENGLPYANSVRPGTERMTGLHFARWDSLYPLPPLDDLDLLYTNDEIVLREICIRKGVPMHDKWFRPVPGVHASPNRKIGGEQREGKRVPGWGVGPWRDRYLEFANSPPFKAIEPHLKGVAREAVDTLRAMILP